MQRRYGLSTRPLVLKMALKSYVLPPLRRQRSKQIRHSSYGWWNKWFARIYPHRSGSVSGKYSPIGWLRLPCGRPSCIFPIVYICHNAALELASCVPLREHVAVLRNNTTEVWCRRCWLILAVVQLIVVCVTQHTIAESIAVEQFQVGTVISLPSPMCIHTNYFFITRFDVARLIRYWPAWLSRTAL